MILVPHEDDDLAIAGSMIYGAVQKKQKIKIVFTTNGDYYKKEGAIRIHEAKCALGVLGVEKKNILFLGYGDSMQGGVHLYNAAEDEVVPSYCGNDTTYGTEDTPEFCMREAGCHHAYNRRNFKQDLKTIVEKYMPQILITTDWDNHADHLALSLLVDEVMGELLREKDNYKPLVLKGLAYNGKWEGRADYYESENVTENYNEAIGTNEVHPLNQWEDRIRFCVPEECATPLLKDNILYRAACAYPSQSVDLKAPQFINRDAVFWRRPTESLTYRADIRTSSGEAAYLKDFKCADCSDILHDFHCYDKSIWMPDEADREKKIVITLERPERISEIHLFESTYVDGQIKNIRIRLDDGTVAFDSGELRHDGSRTIIRIPQQTTSVITLQIDAYEGTQVGLTEIEVYGTRIELEQYALPLCVWDEQRDLPRREEIPAASAKWEQLRYRIVRFGRVRLWPYKYFLMKQYPKLEETTPPPVFFFMHLRFWFMKIFLMCWNNPVLKYIFFGGCATLVNLGSYYLLRVLTPLDLNIANVISVCIAILFAYFTNSRFVFESKASGWNERFGEFVKFVSARILTMIVEVGGVWLMADILKINDYLAKFLIQFIVLVLNYVFSKFLIFTTKNE
jgi:putative flippase GtrA/LmbE family N-acetylglucosaminyl deacetylase